MEITQKPMLYKFNVEIEFTEKSLAVFMEMNDSLDILEHIKKVANEDKRIITSNPSFDSGFGADINDMLSIGILAMSKVEDINIDLGDLNLHPMRAVLPQINKIDLWQVPGRILFEDEI